jgi:hypothetical protein
LKLESNSSNLKLIGNKLELNRRGTKSYRISFNLTVQAVKNKEERITDSFTIDMYNCGELTTAKMILQYSLERNKG